MSGTPGRSLSPVGVAPTVVLTVTGWVGSAVPEIGAPELDVPVEEGATGAEAGVEVGVGVGGDTGILPPGGRVVRGIGTVPPAAAIHALSARRSSSMFIP